MGMTVTTDFQTVRNKIAFAAVILKSVQARFGTMAGTGVRRLQPMMHRRAPIRVALALFVLFLAAPASAGAITASGEARMRYETLDGQFRAGGSGGDQLLAFRTLLHLKADIGPALVGVEFQDSRAYLDDSGTPLTTGYVNPFDVLQAYARIAFPSPLGGQTEATIGRMTLDIGSRRQIARTNFGNVIKSHTGLYLRTKTDDGDELHLFVVSPVEQAPTDRDALGANEVAFDRERWRRWVWAAHYRRANAFPGLGKDIWAEAYLYGLNESDGAGLQTPNRRYVTPGFRLYRAPARSAWDVDLEAAARFGERRATAAASDVRDLRVRAWTLHAAFGYTFDNPLALRLAVDFDQASGDKDPNDGHVDQYESLFGARRTDLGNTSLHGPLAPANLSAPGFRVEIAPSARADARLAYKAASLASPTDGWVVAQLRDPTGRSGAFIGHAIDARARYWLIEKRLQAEIGASALIHGRFAREAPGAPAADRTLFAYGQLAAYF
ncbi:MAG: alginate export family protein [Amphiplicatus sp.]